MKSRYGMIARLLNTRRKTVYFWIKKAGHALAEPAISENMTAIEFDEMWHFFHSKKLWIWKALDRDSRKCIAWVVGQRDTATFKRLYHKVKHLKAYDFTDDWDV